MLGICQHSSTILQCFDEVPSSEIALVRFFKDKNYLLGGTTFCAVRLNISSKFEFECFDDSLMFKCHF